MKKLNRLFVLFCLSNTVTVFSQTAVVKPFIMSQTSDVVASLPSVLLSFDAIINDKKVELTWASNTENNNNFFTIEKSKDAINFEQVTSIKGFGNYSSLINYFDIDYVPYSGISYYRLKQTDISGKTISSRLVSVNNKVESDVLTSYSTVLDENSSTLLGSENKEVLVVLRNEKGQESYSKVTINEKNIVTFSGDNENKLDNGTYLVIASSDSKLYSQKITVK